MRSSRSLRARPRVCACARVHHSAPVLRECLHYPHHAKKLHSGATLKPTLTPTPTRACHLCSCSSLTWSTDATDDHVFECTGLGSGSHATRGLLSEASRLIMLNLLGHEQARQCHWARACMLAHRASRAVPPTSWLPHAITSCPTGLLHSSIKAVRHAHSKGARARARICALWQLFDSRARAAAAGWMQPACCSVATELAAASLCGQAPAALRRRAHHKCGQAPPAQGRSALPPRLLHEAEERWAPRSLFVRFMCTPDAQDVGSAAGSLTHQLKSH